MQFVPGVVLSAAELVIVIDRSIIRPARPASTNVVAREPIAVEMSVADQKFVAGGGVVARGTVDRVT
ncbi:MAG: hypothetical protein ACKO2P_08500 [Planctomycetota bacterium]